MSPARIAPKRPAATIAPVDKAPEIPALTGLRFVAAATIVLAHFAIGSGAVLFGLPHAISAVGMPLFFTLSGFIIHYVYAGAFTRDWRGAVPAFAFARFSRLYPLFFALLCFYALGHLGRLFYAHPGIAVSYASLTGSWWYWVVDGHAMVEERYGISWSISTEVFFYVVYALGLFLIARIRTVRLCAATLVGFCLLAYGMLYVVYVTSPAWEAYVLARHPDFIASATDFQNSFYRWVLYVSPYAHVLEFIAGCLTCQLYLLLRRSGAAARNAGTELAAWLGAAWLIAALVLLHEAWSGGHRGDVFAFIGFLHLNFLMAPGCVLLILALALGGSSIGRVLASPVPKYLGDISYSTYLGHPFALSFMILVGLGQPVYVLTLGLILVVIGASLLYVAIERPAKAWLRAAVAAGIRPLRNVSRPQRVPEPAAQKD
jgi:peptidoglycan/LPS O-acetylase OafA/YrhL